MGGMNDDVDNARADAGSVETVEKFIEWVGGLKGSSFLYRGLADFTWMVESSADRQVNESKGEQGSPEDTKNYILKLLDNARMRGFRAHEGRDLPDLELLARLQHYGAATCLIDFTRNPLVALWFACNEQADKHGKVVAMNVISMDAGADATTLGQDEKSQPQKKINFITLEQTTEKIQKFLDGEKLWGWPPTPREERVIAQQSTFVFGKQEIEGDYEVHIPLQAKSRILRALQQKFDITKESLFGDFAGFALANAYDKSDEAYSADEYFALAESAYKSGNEDEDYEKAIQYCDKAIAKDSQHVEVHHLRGLCNYFLEKWGKSADDFSRAIEKDETHTQSYMERGEIYERKLQEPEKAVDDYTAVINLLSNSERRISRRELPSAYRSRGSLYADLGKHENAIADFTSAIEVSPDWPFAYRDRAESHRALGNEKEARDDDKKAERLMERRYRRRPRRRT